MIERVYINDRTPAALQLHVSHYADALATNSTADIDRAETKRSIALPEEIANIAVFLASPDSSHIVGETITVDGVPRIEETPER